MLILKLRQESEVLDPRKVTNYSVFSVFTSKIHFYLFTNYRYKKRRSRREGRGLIQKNKVTSFLLTTGVIFYGVHTLTGVV